jgi:hypothetical protein
VSTRVGTVQSLASASDQAHLVSRRERLPDRIDRDKSAGHLSGYLFAVPVRQAGRSIPRRADGVPPECWILTEWSLDAREPRNYWFSDFPPTPLNDLVRLAQACRLVSAPLEKFKFV